MLFLTALVIFFCHSEVANDGRGLFLPPELVEQIKIDFSLEKKPGISFEKRPITIHIKPDNKKVQSQILGLGNNDLDFADYGLRTKVLNIRLEESPSDQSKSKPHDAPAARLILDTILEKAYANDHAAPPPAHGAPAAGPGAPAAGLPAGNGEKTLYFVNRYRETKFKGRSVGLPCGKALKIQSRLDDLFNPQGINSVTAGGRHLDIWGGDFVLAHLEEETLVVSFFRLTDSRYANRLCKMSFE